MTWGQLGKILGQVVVIIAAVATAIETLAKGDNPKK